MLVKIEEIDTLETIHPPIAYGVELLRKKGLYQINALVDLNNYLSLKLKFPLGSYDLDKIFGNVVLSSGTSNDSYQGIGKSEINLENLLLLKDDKGPFGSPTSDSNRTMIDIKTKIALVVSLYVWIRVF
ncbi:phenylalanine--tRNA ligase beta subunit-related protein [Clostridium sp. LBM24168]